MSYYTAYELKVYDPVQKEQVMEHENSPGPIAMLRSESEEASYCLDEEGDTADGGKWYHVRTDLQEFSRKHPAWLFVLDARGEENGDRWRSFFLSGKEVHQKAVFVFPDTPDFADGFETWL